LILYFDASSENCFFHTEEQSGVADEKAVFSKALLYFSCLSENGKRYISAFLKLLNAYLIGKLKFVFFIHCSARVGGEITC
jgi:hypothetical protein